VNGSPNPWIFVALAALAVAVGVIMWRREQQRQSALRVWAFGRGWRVRPGGEGGPLYEHPAVTLLNRGHTRRYGCLIDGDLQGQSLQMFDYRYVTGHGKNRATHLHGVAILTVPFPVRPLRIRPENALDKLGEFLGTDDIDFESAEFSRRFHVSADDRKWAFDVIHTRMMEYLLKAPPEWSLEFGSHEIVAFRRGYAQGADYEAAMALLQGVRALIPEYLIRQQRGETT